MNPYSLPLSSHLLPSPLDRFSYLLFTCSYSLSQKLPFRVHGDCPAVVTSLVSLPSSSLTSGFSPTSGIIVDINGLMSEELSAFGGLNPAVGDIIVSINGASVAHLNSMQIKRLVKRIRHGVSTTFSTNSNGIHNDSYVITFRRLFLEVSEVLFSAFLFT
jgi:hypothetical protein